MAVRKIANKVYSDLNPEFIPHPTSGDVVRITNENSVRTAVKSLLLTSYGERLFQPNIGTGLNDLLFDLMHQGTSELISYEIENVLTKYEPRISLKNVLVEPLYDQNAYSINIEYTIIGFTNIANINILLERTR